MQIPRPRKLSTVLAAMLFLPVFAHVGWTLADADASAARLAAGKQLATTRGNGNCLACHAMADGELPGSLGQAAVRKP